MNNKKTIAALLAAASLTFGTTAFADGTFDGEAVSEGLNSFATTVNTAVPDAATMQNVWSNAFIGTIYPGLKFGFGASLGGTLIDFSGFKSAADALTGGMVSEMTPTIAGYEIQGFKLPDKFLLPTASVDLRIGGLILPFDIGISGMVTAPSFKNIDYSDPATLAESISNSWEWNLSNFNGSVSYTAIGLDLRYCLYEGSLIVPKISLGGGYYYINGSFAVNRNEAGEYESYKYNSEAALGLSYNTNVYFANLQLSKNFGIVEVFLGGRALYARSASDWSWKYEVTSEDGSTTYSTDSDSGSVTKGEGKIYTTNEDGTVTVNVNAIQPQLYLGLGGNFGIFSVSFNVCADLGTIQAAAAANDASQFIWSGGLNIHVTL